MNYSQNVVEIMYKMYNALFKEAAIYFGLDCSRFSTHSASAEGAFSDYGKGPP